MEWKVSFEAYDAESLTGSYAYLCCKSEDREQASAFAQYLNDYDIPVWFDSRPETGVLVDKRRMKMIEKQNCAVVVLFASENAAAPAIQQELRQARGKNKPVVAVLLTAQPDLQKLFGASMASYIQPKMRINAHSAPQPEACDKLLEAVCAAMGIEKPQKKAVNPGFDAAVGAGMGAAGGTAGGNDLFAKMKTSQSKDKLGVSQSSSASVSIDSKPFGKKPDAGQSSSAAPDDVVFSKKSGGSQSSDSSSDSVPFGKKFDGGSIPDGVVYGKTAGSAAETPAEKALRELEKLTADRPSSLEGTLAMVLGARVKVNEIKSSSDYGRLEKRVRACIETMWLSVFGIVDALVASLSSLDRDGCILVRTSLDIILPDDAEITTPMMLKKRSEAIEAIEKYIGKPITVTCAVRDSINPLALANGTTYRFIFDGGQQVDVVAGKGLVKGTTELYAGSCKVTVKVYAWDDPECKKAPSYQVEKNFEVRDGVELVANRPGMLGNLEIDIR